jgi:hypothetical protein
VLAAANVNVPDREGMSPARASHGSRGYWDMVRILENAGGTVTGAFQRYDKALR